MVIILGRSSGGVVLDMSSDNAITDEMLAKAAEAMGMQK
jgi:hypothetical protein